MNDSGRLLRQMPALILFGFLLYVTIMREQSHTNLTMLHASGLALGFFTLNKFHESFGRCMMRIQKLLLSHLLLNSRVVAFAQRIVQNQQSVQVSSNRPGSYNKDHPSKIDSMKVLTSGLAHELNNPLNVIGGVVEPIRKDLNELRAMVSESNGQTLIEEVDALLSDIQDGAVRASGIVSNFVNITSKTKINRHVSFVANEVLVHQLEDLERIHPQINFRFDIEPGVKIHGNIDELSSAIGHLLKNAIDASSPGGIVRLAIRETDTDLIMEIDDDGIGIAYDHLDHIYDPFFTTKETGEGSGLGLFAVYKIVQKHLGSISVSTRENEGTTFVIVLPRHDGMI